MSRTTPAVQAELLQISPPGAAYPSDPNSNWGRQLLPLASEISLVEAQAEAMLLEIDPRTTEYLLPEYQQMLGPDPYGRDLLPLSTAQQQQLAWQRLTWRGGQSKAYFIALAASLGVTINITEQRPAIYGRAVYGDRYLISPEQFTWIVTMPSSSVEYARYGSARYGDDYSNFQPNSVQDVIAAEEPAHTLAVFSYTG
jgi:uncharacterized protein YmfQ (DUF2313 family)